MISGQSKSTGSQTAGQSNLQKAAGLLGLGIIYAGVGVAAIACAPVFVVVRSAAIASNVYKTQDGSFGQKIGAAVKDLAVTFCQEVSLEDALTTTRWSFKSGKWTADVEDKINYRELAWCLPKLSFALCAVPILNSYKAFLNSLNK